MTGTGTGPVSEDMRAVTEVLDRLAAAVESARSMPMSASCVVNRAEVLALVDEARARLPEALTQAHDVLGDRHGVVEDGRREAERLLAEAERERAQMVQHTDVLREARAEAERLLQDAREQAAAVRAEVEDYCDRKLANFEVVLTRTLAAVERGRAQMAGVTELDALRGDLTTDPDAPPLPG